MNTALIKNIQNRIGSKNFLVFFVRVIIIIVFFILGYSLGKHQNKAEVSSLTAQQQPDMLPSVSAMQQGPPAAGISGKATSTGIKTSVVETAHKLETRLSTSESSTTGLISAAPIKTQPEAVSPTQAEPAVGKQIPAAPIRSVTTSSGAKPLFTLQLASFREKKLADDQVKWLKNRGYRAFIVSSELPDKSTWYRVRLGGFPNRAEAAKMQKKIRAKEKVSPIIIVSQ